jgi:hypothetical protein
MADANDDHYDPVVVDSIQDPIIPNPQSPAPARFVQQLRACRSRVTGEGVNCPPDTAANRLGQVGELARG